MDTQPDNLGAWYASRCKFRLPRSPSLPLRHRLVLDGLCYFDRFGRGATASSLHRLTGLCRSTTIPRLRRGLEEDFGLAAARDGLSYPVDPGEGSLVLSPRKALPSEEPRHWSHRLAYDWQYVLSPGSSLTPAQVAVFGRLIGLSKDGLTVVGQTRSGLAALVGISRHAASDALAALEGLGLLAVLRVGAGSRMALGFNRPDGAMLAHFAERKRSRLDATEAELVRAHVESLRRDAPAPQQNQGAPAGATGGVLGSRKASLPSPQNKKEREVIREMDGRGLPPRAIREFVEFYREVGGNVAVDLLNRAAREHRRNFAKEKGVPQDELSSSEGLDCSGLLLYKMRRYAGSC